MERRPYEVRIEINVYDRKANINGVDKFFGLYDSKKFTFNITDICIVCAIHKAKEYLQDNYKDKHIDWIKIDAYEEPVVTIFIEEDDYDYD